MTRDLSAGSLVRHGIDAVIVAATVLIAWYLWPAFLGGSSRLITVHGHSMEPTYQPGDLVLLDTEISPSVADIIVFRIPANEPGAGQLVVHRIVGLRDDGTYVTKGDNSQNADTFQVSRGDILGSPRFSVPHGGQVIAVLSTPIGIGVATGFLCTALLWPRRRDQDAEHLEASAADADECSPIVGADGVTSSEAVIAEAEEWLRLQVPQLM
jgi:signal peptidase